LQVNHATLEENKIVGSANVIAYAMKESWSAGFEEGRKYPLSDLNGKVEKKT
jgi:hypothetical protein